MVNVYHALLVVLATHFLAMQGDEFWLQTRHVLVANQIHWSERDRAVLNYIKSKYI